MITLITISFGTLWHLDRSKLTSGDSENVQECVGAPDEPGQLDN